MAFHQQRRYNAPLFAPPVSDMKKSPAPKTFEEAIKHLETLTQAMQNSEMPLEEALAAYQEGNELVKYCQTKLAEVEQKLQVLDADGLKELTLNADE
jgi:exodeoxyribonuclease VII, small subunit